ncbi:hypothetical protein [Polymorphobacter sp.]|uniref:hypothetical protein n=1 Tax=Polymorphobacter sp. TaxID=1909290 RepID=UPI003F72C91A
MLPVVVGWGSAGESVGVALWGGGLMSGPLSAAPGALLEGAGPGAGMFIDPPLSQPVPERL